jgi:hypothetical protein
VGHFFSIAPMIKWDTFIIANISNHTPIVKTAPGQEIKQDGVETKAREIVAAQLEGGKRWDEIISLIFQGVLAFFTIGFTVATVMHYRSTYRYAQATEKLVEVTKQYTISTESMAQNTEQQHEWERLKAVHDLVDRMYAIGYYETMERLESIPCLEGKKIDTDDQSQNYNDVVCQQNEEEIRNCLSRILAFCEEIALGVRHDIYQSSIAYDYFGFLLPNIYRWSEPHVKEVRKRTGDCTIYREMESLSEKWCILNKDQTMSAL